jgi:hypothetical protein
MIAASLLAGPLPGPAPGISVISVTCMSSSEDHGLLVVATPIAPFPAILLPWRAQMGMVTPSALRIAIQPRQAMDQGTGVSVGARGVSVGGTGVLVGGSGVLVGGSGVLVGGSGVSVAGRGVSVGGIGVSVGGSPVGVSVGGSPVGVSVGGSPVGVSVGGSPLGVSVGDLVGVGVEVATGMRVGGRGTRSRWSMYIMSLTRQLACLSAATVVL